jgi:hypothetical protein
MAVELERSSALLLWIIVWGFAVRGDLEGLPGGGLLAESTSSGSHESHPCRTQKGAAALILGPGDRPGTERKESRSRERALNSILMAIAFMHVLDSLDW